MRLKSARPGLLFTLTLVIGLVAAFIVAMYLSYWGSKNVRNAFQYEAAVVAAQRDSDVLQVDQADRAPQSLIRFHEKLLDSDLLRIDSSAEDEREQAPHFAFPATRLDYENLDAALSARAALGQQRFESAVDRNDQTRNVSNVLFAIVALLFTLVQLRLRLRIERGRSLVERLQRAFVSRPGELANVDVGSVLISATEGSEVGGDLFDVYGIDGRYGAFLVADVSGKGIDAAVDTAFIKYSIRTLLSQGGTPDPGVAVTKFAALFDRNVQSRETFVVLFLAVIDTATGDVRYASAGHEPACARFGSRIATLAPTGPIVGILQEARYETHSFRLASGDSLLIATDGLTESRNKAGEELGIDGTCKWFAELKGDAQGRADAIVERLRRRSPRIGDDLAILVVNYIARAQGLSVPADGTLARDAVVAESPRAAR